ncbi:RNA 2',3'-cyclic phosphodiesterase [uncultured Ilyobacter sp.]|uniref:RNA 2',3'-cyclic phosphodiesterase n=1 Tax=uncultured Ilyobacter sp. TaxID=544433 RepID=UPI0029F5B931|nr:RNA 2',3'-cyclic phosphodiesterase [uncultured Ilyobacter sp.]
MRLFFAVDIPEDIKKRLKHEICELEKMKIPCKFVKLKNLHMTLLFLGEVKEEELQGIIEKVEKFKSAPVEVSMKNFGYFADKRKNVRIIWKGLSKGEKRLSSVSKFLIEANREILEKNELTSKPFKGHLTVGRIKKWDRKVSQKIMEEIIRLNKIAENESFRIENFHLYKSTLTPHGSEYELIKTFPLKDRI